MDGLYCGVVSCDEKIAPDDEVYFLLEDGM